MEVVPPAPPIDAEMAEDAEAMMASQAAGGAIDSMEYDEEAEAPRYDEAGDVEINDAHQEHDDARSTEMGEEDARDYATLAHAAALQQEFATSSSSMTGATAAPMDGALVEAPMLPVVSSDGMQASQVVDDERLETEAGYEPVEADAPAEEQGAQIVEVQDEAADAEPVAQPQPGQAGDTAQGEAITEPSAVSINAEEDSASVLAAASSTSNERQHDEAQAEPEASAEEHHATSNEDGQAHSQASAAAAEQQASASEANHDDVAESSTAAIHPADAPQVKEGNENGTTAAHNAGASTYSPSSANTTPPPTLRLTFEEESFVLFPSSSESSQYLAYPTDGTDGPIQSVDAIPLSVPTEVYWEPLEALFKGLRVKEALGEFLEGGAGAAAGAGKEGAPVATGSVGSDLVLRLPDLGLVVREDSVYTREVRLVDLVRLHEGLGAQSSLHIEVSEDDSFLHELRGLQEHVKENAGALQEGEQESGEGEDGVETGETTVDGHPVQQEEGEDEAAAAQGDGQSDAQQDDAGVDAAEQTFVTVGEGHEDDQDGDDDDDNDTAGHTAADADAQHDDGGDPQAESEAEPEAEEPSYEPVEDGDAEVDAEDAAAEQAEGEEKLVEYEEEEEEEGAAEEGDEQQQDGEAEADQYEEEDANDHEAEEEDGEEQQDEDGDYAEEEADAEEGEDGYGEDEEAVDDHAEDDEDAPHDEDATAAEEVNGNGAAAPEAPARLGKRSFDGEDELNDGDNDAPHGESGVEAKKVKASH